MAHEGHEKWLCDILHDNTPEVPELSDLTGWWRLYPPEASDPNHPDYADRMEWLVEFIVLADWNHWAREGLHQFHRELSGNGESIPPLLKGWVQDELAQGKRGAGPGRPPKPDRDFRVLMGYTMLFYEEFTYLNAIFEIADCLGCPSDTVRSIIYKHRGALPRRR